MIKKIFLIFILFGGFLLGSLFFPEDSIIWASDSLSYSSLDLTRVDSAATNFACADVNGIPIAECEVLVTLYQSTDGANWSNNTGWLITNTPCSWHGVVCAGGRVSQLNLSSNQLSGTIPPELGNLTNLITLILQTNQLSGTIPSELGNLTSLVHFQFHDNLLEGAIPASLANLTNLTHLYLERNALSGIIPSELGNLTNLKYLHLNENQISGSIPPELGNLTNLERLFLEENQLSGTIPTELSNLTNITLFLLNRNQLSGTIPSELSALPKVTHLYLDENQLTGTIPPELGDLMTLNALYLDSNQLTGTIPPELGNLTNLTYLHLHSNQLSGAIPSELWNLTNLNNLILSDNELSGSIPPEVGNLTNLRNFQLNTNQLSGSIPPELGNLANLEILFLEENQLSGTIPVELSNLDNVTHLYLDRNQLSGTIPPELSALPKVTHLYLDENQLTGTIPPELGNLMTLNALYLDSNQLTGTIPPELGNLTNLTYLHLHSNQLSGAIPSELWNLTNLNNFILSDNELSGSIPPEVGNLTNLKNFQLDANQLSGSIPSELGNLTNLEILYLDENQLSGTIPVELSNLDNVTHLYLDRNQLSGTIPPELSALPKVTHLYLDENQLTGTIPPELGNLITLNALYLDSNQLTGTIPPELGNLTNLTYLHLYSNQLSGTIPSELGNLTNLNNFILSDNELSGTIPPELGNITNVKNFQLSANQLSGSIPTELGNLTNLELLFLHENQLSGIIPPELGNLTNLLDLRLRLNQLSGTIPPELGNLVNLTYISLAGNQLSGTIPIELSNLTNVTHFYLHQNQLSGTIPPELGMLRNVIYLYLGENQLTGTIPPELGNLTTLTHLYLYSNQLTGTIPPELGNLANLQYLYLYLNQLSGTIPPELGNLTNLINLYLFSNQLSGTIPPELGSLTNLKSFVLADNNLSGSIPPELSNLANLEMIQLYSNQLTGPIPATLANLANLSYIHLNSNQLSGAFPEEFCNAPSLTEIRFALNSDLTGPLPSCLTDLPLTSLDFSGTYICEPSSPEFEQWLGTITNLGRTYESCGGPPLSLSIESSTATAISGDSILYRLVISTTEENIAITLTNTLPSELSNIQNVSGATYDAATHQILYQGSIVSGTLHAIEYRAQLVQGLTPGTVILNSVELSGGGPVRERSVSVAIESNDSHALVLVYVTGDNNLSSEALRAINNAELAAGNSAIKIRYLLDGPGSDDTYIFNLEPDQDPSCPNYINVTCSGRYVLGENLWKWTDNTASPHSLAEFISSSIRAYPNATAIYLVVAGHGNGWGPNVLPHQPRGWDIQSDLLGGLLADDHPHGFLSTRAFGIGLEWAYQATGRKIDLLYLDACSMGQLEVAYEIRESVSYLLASENTSWTAFPYDEMFSAINNPPQTAQAVGQSWLSIEADLLRSEGYPFTLSLTDLNQMDALLAAQSALANELQNNLSSRKSKIIEAVQASECFDSDYDGTLSSSADNYCDLQSFVTNIAAQFSDEPALVQAAQSVNTVLADAVIQQDYAGGIPWVYPDQSWDWQGLGGLSLYLPFQEDEWKRKYYNQNHLSSARDGQWDDLVYAFWSEDLPLEEPSLCTVDNCDGLGSPLPVLPELESPENITVTTDSTLLLPITLEGYGYHLVNAEVDVAFDNSCLSVEDVQFNLPTGFVGNYNIVGDNVVGNAVALAITTTATPQPSLIDDTIATIEFSATCSAPVTVTQALFEDVDQNSLEGLTGSTQVELVETADFVLDNNNSAYVQTTGDWVVSQQIQQPYGTDYLHDDNSDKGQKSVQFLPNITEPCAYQVDMYWTASNNRATNVPVDIVHSTGTETVYVNQQANGSQWNSLGIYVLSAGANVTVRTDNTDGHVIVDAVRFTPLLPCTNLNIPVISAQPQYDTVVLSSSTSTTITVDFMLEDIIALYAGQIKVEYDNTILEAIDFDLVKPGLQLEHGDLLPAETVILNGIDQVNGLIEYSISRQGEVATIDGSGLFARAYFRAIGIGVSPLNFTYTTFNTRLPKPIPVALQNSQIEVIANTVTLTGTVTLADQTDSSGITVCVGQNCTTTDSNGSYTLENVSPVIGSMTLYMPGYVHLTYSYSGTAGETIAMSPVVLNPLHTTLSLSGIVTDVHSEVDHGGVMICLNSNCIESGSDGSYQFTDAPLAGTITYVKAHYLTATVHYAGNAGSHINLPGIEMRGGDVNQDGQVSGADANLIGQAWGSGPNDPHWDPRANLYGNDNIVDVIDMTFVQRNWQRITETFHVGTALSRRARSNSVSQAPATATDARIWVDGASHFISNPGQEIVADIQVADVDGMYSFDVVLNFDPTVLQVRSQEDVRAGEFLDTTYQYVVVNDFDNELGRVALAVTQLHPAQVRSGSGLLGRVVFESIGAGDGQVRIVEAELLDNGKPNPGAISTRVDSVIYAYLPLVFNE